MFNFIGLISLAIFFNRKPTLKYLLIFSLLDVYFISPNYSQVEPYYPCINPPYDPPSGDPGPPTLCAQYGSNSNFVTLGVDKISDLNPINNQISGYIHIDRNLLIDVNNFAFNNAIIMIDAGVSILVSPSINFKIVNSKLFCCTLLWKGIFLDANSAISTSSNTIIEDAEGAIQDINKQAYLSIENTTFNRNRIGIYFEAPLGSLFKPNAYITRFKKNSFTCTSPLNGTTNEITTAGIKLNRFPLYLPDGQIVFRSLFKGIQYGILQIDIPKMITLRNLKFEDIKIAGIRAMNGNINIFNLEFLNNHRNVSIQNVYSLKILNCNFTLNNSVNFAYFKYISNRLNSILTTVHKSNCNINIENCVFKDECNLLGPPPYYYSGSNFIRFCDKDFINDFQNYVVGSVEDNQSVVINNNEFRQSVNGSSTACIHALGNFPTNSTISITFNHFFIGSTGYFHAIYMDGKKSKVSISNNDIKRTLAQSPFQAPIQLDFIVELRGSYGDSLVFTDNIMYPWIDDFTDPNNPLISHNFVGAPFYIANAMHATICGNQSYDCFRGIDIEGVCDLSSFSNNLSRLGTLLRLIGNASAMRGSWIGKQDWKANRWYPALFGGGYTPARCEYERLAQNSLFQVHENRPSPYYPSDLIPEIIPNTTVNWWTYVSHAIDICNPPGIQLSLMEQYVLNDSIASLVSNNEYLYNIKYTYYKNFDKYSSIISYPPEVDSFLTYVEVNTNMDLWRNIEENLDQLYFTSLTNVNSLNELRSDYNGIIVLLDSLFIDGTANDSATLKSLLAGIDSISNDQLQLFSSMEELNHERIENLYFEVLNTPTSNYYELYMKNVISIYLFYKLNGFITNDMSDELVEISNACTFDYDYLPYFANQLIPYCFRNSAIPNNECIPSQPFSGKESELKNIENDLNIFLINLDGKVIKKIQDESQLPGDKSIKSGLYILKIGTHAKKYFHN